MIKPLFIIPLNTQEKENSEDKVKISGEARERPGGDGTHCEEKDLRTSLHLRNLVLPLGSLYHRLPFYTSLFLPFSFSINSSLC